MELYEEDSKGSHGKSSMQEFCRRETWQQWRVELRLISYVRESNYLAVEAMKVLDSYV